MTITYMIEDPIAELVRLRESARQQYNGAQTIQKRQRHTGEMDAYANAIETIDAHERCKMSGEAVQLRNWHTVARERGIEVE